MDNAKRLASEIRQAVEDALQSGGDLEALGNKVKALGNKVKALWAEASHLGVYFDVDAILQEESRREMEEALVRNGIDAE